MSLKQSNEITVKVKGNLDNLYKLLEEKSFKISNEFKMEDTFFIPKYLEIDKMTCREILSKAVLIRDIYITTKNLRIKKLTFKRKNIDENGNILSQDSVNVDILNIEDGKKFLEAIGYIEIIKIKEEDREYKKDDLVFSVKDIKNGDKLIEFETVEDNENLDTIEKIKKAINEIGLPIYTDNYFVKKAEIELEKVLKGK